MTGRIRKMVLLRTFLYGTALGIIIGSWITTQCHTPTPSYQITGTLHPVSQPPPPPSAPRDTLQASFPTPPQSTSPPPAETSHPGKRRLSDSLTWYEYVSPTLKLRVRAQQADSFTLIFTPPQPSAPPLTPSRHLTISAWTDGSIVLSFSSPPYFVALGYSPLSRTWKAALGFTIRF